jgi:hypothetical protein
MQIWEETLVSAMHTGRARQPLRNSMRAGLTPEAGWASQTQWVL